MLGMQCPKCGHVQDGGLECQACGVIFSKVTDSAESRADDGLYTPETRSPLDQILGGTTALEIEQEGMDLVEVYLDFERANEYSVADQDGRVRAVVVEQGRGLAAGFLRNFFGSRRPLKMIVFDLQNHTVLEVERPWFFFFSTMKVSNASGKALGTVHRRFTLVGSRYSLVDPLNREFATIRKPWFRIWKFPIFDRFGRESGMIAKKWSGYWREVMSDHDKFGVVFGESDWSLEQKAVIMATALSIDMDFFEDNQQR